MSRGERSMVPAAEPRTYYDLPVLKEPVWKWEIPAYLFTGGVAAGTSLLAAGADLTGNRTLARNMQCASLGALAASGALLTADLGVPSRVHHMLRVAKPTSPMSVGSWLLTAFGVASAVATASIILDRFPTAGRLGRLVAAGLAPALATYTGVLIADTAVPVWHESRRTLPYLFAAGAAASAGALGTMLTDPVAALPARRLALAGAATEILTIRLMERQLDPVVAEPYRTGTSAILGRVGQACTVAGAVLSLVGHRRGGRARAVTGGGLIFAGAALARFSVMYAGRASAADPRATVAPQRARLGTRPKAERNPT